MKSQGFLGESIHGGSVVVIKTHSNLSKRRNIYDRVILLIRNPYDTFVAEYHRQRAGHMGFAGDEHFLSPGKQQINVRLIIEVQVH